MSRHDIYQSLILNKSPPTRTQKLVIEEISSGGKLIGKFDVWGGYDWFLCRQNGMVSGVSRATVQGLMDRRLVVQGDAERAFSGRQETIFRLSPAAELRALRERAGTGK